jgi:hypothetical protein
VAGSIVEVEQVRTALAGVPPDRGHARGAVDGDEEVEVAVVVDVGEGDAGVFEPHVGLGDVVGVVGEGAVAVVAEEVMRLACAVGHEQIGPMVVVDVDPRRAASVAVARHGQIADAGGDGGVGEARRGLRAGDGGVAQDHARLRDVALVVDQRLEDHRLGRHGSGDVQRELGAAVGAHDRVADDLRSPEVEVDLGQPRQPFADHADVEAHAAVGAQSADAERGGPALDELGRVELAGGEAGQHQRVDLDDGGLKGLRTAQGHHRQHSTTHVRHSTRYAVSFHR